MTLRRNFVIAIFIIFLSLSLLPVFPVSANIVIFDDDGVSFWDTSGATESNDAVQKQSGSDSYKLILSASSFNSLHTFGSSQDFTSEDNCMFWFYGINVGWDIWLRFFNVPQGDDYYYTIITLDFVGWQQFSVPRSSFLISGSPTGWNNINQIELYALGTSNGETIRIDLLKFDSESASGSEQINTSLINAALLIASMFSIIMILLILKAVSTDMGVKEILAMGMGIMVLALVLLAFAAWILTL